MFDPAFSLELADDLGSRVPIHDWHFHVHQADVKGTLVASREAWGSFYYLNSFFAIICCCDSEASAFEFSYHDLLVDNVVLYKKDVRSCTRVS